MNQGQGLSNLCFFSYISLKLLPNIFQCLTNNQIVDLATSFIMKYSKWVQLFSQFINIDKELGWNRDQPPRVIPTLATSRRLSITSRSVLTVAFNYTKPHKKINIYCSFDRSRLVLFLTFFKTNNLPLNWSQILHTTHWVPKPKPNICLDNWQNSISQAKLLTI